MNTEYTAIVKQSGDWWIGWIKETPGVNCQERTHEELIKSFKITLKEALEFNCQDAVAAVGSGYSVPRHSEVDDNLARKICKDLGIKQIK